MGSLSKIAPECAKCFKRDTCIRKRMITVDYLEQPSMREGSMDVAQPVFQPALRDKLEDGLHIGVREKTLRRIKEAVEESLSNRFIDYGA